MKHPCNVIRDLLPLYVDEVCSAESRKMIEEHLKECSECKAYMESMSDDGSKANQMIQDDPENENRKVSSLRNVKKKIQRRQILTAVVTVLILVCVSFAVIGGLKRVNRIVEYDNNLSVSMVDGSLVGRLYGSCYTDLKIRNISVDNGGASSNYIFYRVSDTLWDDISTSKNMMTEYVICPAEKSADMVDRVYYYTGDLSGLENMDEAELQTVIQNSILLWEKTK